MRPYILLAAAVLLAGCGPGQFYSPERINQRVAAGNAQRAAHAASPGGQAEANCATKVAMAMGGYRGGDEVAYVVRKMQMEAQCMDYWRRTGQMP